MKSNFCLFLFFISISVYAQIAPILDHTWTIEQIDTGNNIIPADPNPLGEDEPYQPFFSHTSNNFDFYYNYYAQCEYFLTFDYNNSQLYHHFQGCALATGEISQIAHYFNYTFIQQNTNIATTVFDPNLVSYGPLTYSFTSVGDMIYMDITNSIGEVATFYAANLSQDEFLKESISIFPNPVSEVLNIKSSSIPIEKVKVYDMNGRLVLETNSNSGEINVSALQKGVYVLTVETSVGILREKMVKN